MKHSRKNLPADETLAGYKKEHKEYTETIAKYCISTNDKGQRRCPIINVYGILQYSATTSNAVISLPIELLT
jgi:hypothetical protein